MDANFITLLIYVPLIVVSRLMEWLGFNVDNVPLSYYRKYSLYIIIKDARDRFGTPLERRFSKGQIAEMMKKAGLVNVRFSEAAPFWCAVGNKDKSCADSQVS
jgi:hypothetical protein